MSHTFQPTAIWRHVLHLLLHNQAGSCHCMCGMYRSAWKVLNVLKFEADCTQCLHNSTKSAHTSHKHHLYNSTKFGLHIKHTSSSKFHQLSLTEHTHVHIIFTTRANLPHTSHTHIVFTIPPTLPHTSYTHIVFTISPTLSHKSRKNHLHNSSNSGPHIKQTSSLKFHLLFPTYHRNILFKFNLICTNNHIHIVFKIPHNLPHTSHKYSLQNSNKSAPHIKRNVYTIAPTLPQTSHAYRLHNLTKSPQYITHTSYLQFHQLSLTHHTQAHIILTSSQIFPHISPTQISSSLFNQTCPTHHTHIVFTIQQNISDISHTHQHIAFKIPRT
jgi:hypothetical protein